ncbi:MULTISPECIES: hypothetical protein [unclassified Clostridium]|uniref:hypothetical protein n=1 Tax=unclassified Clostridium TaxID=2614128 RepID=UPI0032173FCF
MFDINHLMKTPEDESVKIWRYMSLKKFESLLKEQALYFCNSKSFKDNHEGSYCRKNLHTEVYMDGLGILENYTDKHRVQNQIYRENVHINCWHMNEHENMGMWENYISDESGVAIQSTYKRYGEAVMDDTRRLVFMGIVQYKNYEEDSIQYDEGLWGPFLTKREEFKYEQEIRGVYLLSHNKIDDETQTKGGFVSTDVETLIENVFLYPNASADFRKIVENMVKKYGFELNILDSKLSSEPIF